MIDGSGSDDVYWSFMLSDASNAFYFYCSHISCY